MQSDKLDLLFQAVTKVQAKIVGAKAEAENPFLGKKYADLQSIWDAIRPLLAENGLCAIQTMGYKPEIGATVITTLGHTSGQFITGELPVNAKEHDPQKQGSAISYARRYSLAAIIGIYQIDDDAESATNHGKPQKQAPKPAPKPTTTATTTAPTVMTAKEFMDYVVAKFGKDFITRIVQKLATTFHKEKYDELTREQKLELKKWVDDHSPVNDAPINKGDK